MTTETKHTPGPYRIGKHGNSIVSDSTVDGMSGANEPEYYGGNMVAESVTPANAALIVHRVNVHEELVGALERIEARIKAKGNWELALDYISATTQAAIAKARGE